MSNIIDNIKLQLKQRNVLVMLIAINVGVFLAISAMGIVGLLFRLHDIHLVQYMGVSSNIDMLIYRPWTMFTYMFTHEGFLHLAFNMLMLYWFGQLFLTYFTPKNLGSLYVLGGLAGVMLYVVAFNTIPYYVEMNHPLMIGASASVMAIIFAAAFYRPQQEVMLLLLGRIKVVYIALFLFFLDFISLGDDNAGGHVAHIGGAVIGYVYAKQYAKGHDITAWISRAIDGIANLTKRKPPKMKVKYSKRDSDYNYNQRRHNESEEIDHILDKIKASGYSSLTSNEKKRLFDAGQK